MYPDLQNTNNPFRRKGNPASATPAPTPTTTTTPKPPTPTDSTVSHDSVPAAAAAATAPWPTERRTKPVKRVRVQTPPPLSSDSESESESDDTVDTQPPVGIRWETARGPFEGSRAEEDTAGGPPAQPAGPPQRNPFSKTLQDMEPRQHRDEPRSSARAPGRASLDVEAFRRLLLTGQSAATALGSSPPRAATPPSATPELDTTAETTSFIPRRSRRDPSGEIGAEPASSEARRGTRKPESYESPAQPRTDPPAPAPQRRKPPPPSSRHGRAIQLGHDRPPAAAGHAAPPTPPLARTPSDFGKPLPLAPIRTPSDEDSESVFDREAAGRVPESSEPPSPAASVHEVPGPHRRPTPVPPPRRSRTDGGAVPTNPPAYASELPRRLSVESTLSRAESFRHSAPAPPPPRRPVTGHRSTLSATSLSALSPSTLDPTSPRGQQAAPDSGANQKHALPPPPPPPPTRNASMRRKSSISSAEGGPARRAGAKGGEAAPPPPPRRLRGGSRGSVDLTGEGSRRAGDGAGAGGAGAGVGTVREVDEGGAGEGAAGVILADLGALQREVEELQKRYASVASQREG